MLCIFQINVNRKHTLLYLSCSQSHFKSGDHSKPVCWETHLQKSPDSSVAPRVGGAALVHTGALKHHNHSIAAPFNVQSNQFYKSTNESIIRTHSWNLQICTDHSDWGTGSLGTRTHQSPTCPPCEGTRRSAGCHLDSRGTVRVKQPPLLQLSVMKHIPTQRTVGTQLLVVAREPFPSPPAIVLSFLNNVNLFKLMLTHIATENASFPLLGLGVTSVYGAPPHIANAISIHLRSWASLVFEGIIVRDSV